MNIFDAFLPQSAIANCMRLDSPLSRIVADDSLPPARETGRDRQSKPSALW